MLYPTDAFNKVRGGGLLSLYKYPVQNITNLWLKHELLSLISCNMFCH